MCKIYKQCQTTARVAITKYFCSVVGYAGNENITKNDYIVLYISIELMLKIVCSRSVYLIMSLQRLFHLLEVVSAMRYL